jgi:hypothetical protein
MVSQAFNCKAKTVVIVEKAFPDTPLFKSKSVSRIFKFDANLLESEVKLYFTEETLVRT